MSYFVVTGDRGFVGRRLRSALLAQGHRVLGIGRSAAPVGQGAAYEPLVLDLSRGDDVLRHAAAVRRADAVFHVAARLPESDDDPLPPHLAGNLRTTENLLQVLDGTGIPLVLSSTMSVYGLPPTSLPVSEDQPPRPTEAYGVTKLLAEETALARAQAGGVPCVVLRYPGIFGPGYAYGAVHLYASLALAGRLISVYGNGKIVRDYVHVDDVVQANLLAAQRVRELQSARFHIGGGEPLPLVRVAELVVAAVGQGQIEVNDRPGPFDFGFDIGRARKSLGYEPVALRDRIAQFVAELRQSNAEQAS